MQTRSEQNKLKKQMEKEVLASAFLLLKHDKWKKKSNSFSVEKEGYFLCASLYQNTDLRGDRTLHRVTGRLAAKPMSIDPIYWDISQMPENKKKPLSFRYWAAFQAEPIYFYFDVPLAEEIEALDEIAPLFADWVRKKSSLVVDTLKGTPYNELLQKYSKKRDKSSHTVSMLCSTIAEGKEDEALQIARQLAPSHFRNLFVDGNFNDRVNFYELSILYLAGREVFRDEVLKSHVPFNTEDLPVQFCISNFNSDSELQTFEKELRDAVSGKPKTDQVRLALAWVICKRVEIGVHIDDLAENTLEAQNFIRELDDRSAFNASKLTAFESRLEALEKKVQKFSGSLPTANHLKKERSFPRDAKRPERILPSSDEYKSPVVDGIAADRQDLLLGIDTSSKTIKLPLAQAISLSTDLKQFESLESLTLTGKGSLEEIAFYLSQLPNLRSLKIEDNSTNLGPEIGQLSSLTGLNLNENGMTSLPAEIGELTQLQSFACAGNRIPKLPENLKNLTKLEGLFIGRNELTVIPEWIGELTSLKRIESHENKIHSVKCDWSLLGSLARLNLLGNALSGCLHFRGFERLGNLEFLSIGNADISSLPEALWSLPKLRNMELRSFEMRGSLDSLSRLRSLQYLTLADGGLTTLPKSVYELDCLQGLNVSDNPELKLTDDLVRLTQLKYLWVENNGLESLPNSLKKLAQFSFAYIYGNCEGKLKTQFADSPYIKMIETQKPE